MEPSRPPLLATYARNVEILACKRGWTFARLARELSVSDDVLHRLRYYRGRYIDPDLFVSILELFNCEPNDLLLPQPGIEYPSP